MTLDEAIRHAENEAGCDTECQREHKQLADWLRQLKEYDENVKYLLDTTKDAVRSRYKGGPEALVESLCLNYIAMRNATGRTQELPSNVPRNRQAPDANAAGDCPC